MISLFVQKNRISRIRKNMASKITTNKGFNDLKLHLTQTDQENTNFMVELWREIAHYTLRLLKYYSPKNTGTYAESWTVLKQTQKQLVIGLPNNPELMLIFRIKEYTGITQAFIRPKAKQVLSWIDPFTNERVFAKYVTVSPLQRDPVPHFRPTIRQLKRDLPALTQYVMRRHFKFVDRTMPNNMGRRKPSGNFGGRAMQNRTGRKRLYKKFNK